MLKVILDDAESIDLEIRDAQISSNYDGILERFRQLCEWHPLCSAFKCRLCGNAVDHTPPTITQSCPLSLSSSREKNTRVTSFIPNVYHASREGSGLRYDPA